MINLLDPVDIGRNHNRGYWLWRSWDMLEVRPSDRVMHMLPKTGSSVLAYRGKWKMLPNWNRWNLVISHLQNTSPPNTGLLYNDQISFELMKCVGDNKWYL